VHALPPMEMVFIGAVSARSLARCTLAALADLTP
jgi:hypothetical protein